MPYLKRAKTPEEAESMYQDVLSVLPNGMYNRFGVLATSANSNESVPVFFGSRQMNNDKLPILNGFTILLHSLERDTRASSPAHGALAKAMQGMFGNAQHEPSPWTFMAYIARRRNQMNVPTDFVDKLLEKGWMSLQGSCARITYNLDLETTEGLGIFFTRLCRMMIYRDGDVPLTAEGVGGLEECASS
ncbi:hypothetical protein IMZ48_08680, partial [Candidatus Bathyarchaeota archaeon]|nr:hypothetical protein [Candidatus Bathyarchaeota archaeon]